MIKIEQIEFGGKKLDFVNYESMAWAIRGMRNPKNSWAKSDSYFDEESGKFILGENDKKLAETLAKNGPVHGKFQRMIVVQAEITAPRYWWTEYDTYKVGTVANSCSTMFKLTSRPLTIDDFSHDGRGEIGMDYLKGAITNLNERMEQWKTEQDSETKDKIWRSIIDDLPQGYMQKRTCMLNYQVLSNMYENRKHHKLKEWHDMCDWIETLPYADGLIYQSKREQMKDIVEKTQKAEKAIEKPITISKDSIKIKPTTVLAFCDK